MKQFYIVTNPDKDPKLTITKSVIAYLQDKGCVCACQNEQEHADVTRVPKETECIISLGGDGTMIRAIRELSELELPVIGVNLGTLGYLAEVDKDSLYTMLDRLIEDKYVVDSRMMLTGSIVRNGQVIYKDAAVNDIVLGRACGMNVICFQIYVDGEFLAQYSADGIIISTPTGSTAYNLSAGGPIVEPGASIVVLTPISPHTLNNRSIVLSSKTHITLELTSFRGKTPDNALAAYDGEEGIDLQPGDKIEIDEAEKVIRILKLSNISFLEILRKKLSD